MHITADECWAMRRWFTVLVDAVATELVIEASEEEGFVLIDSTGSSHSDDQDSGPAIVLFGHVMLVEIP